MATVVIPFRSSDPKRRLDGLGADARADLAHAMLADVLAAAAPLGPVFVVAPVAPGVSGVEWVDDPHGGQGAAVCAGLDAAVATASTPPILVVNADLPCVATRDLLALAGAMPGDGLALAAAPDGTTNALAPSRRLDAPNLIDDVDTLDDLDRLRDRLGEHTRRVLASLDLQSAA